GKTTLARIIANELKTNIKITNGAILEKAGDLSAISNPPSNILSKYVTICVKKCGPLLHCNNRYYL
ncbi:MAG: hypothetical protein Q8835_03525, partial [Sweet potato little leaf phytoplasma]|nr:hypothetical protein [Sweet potato little leaf phytoplasma]